MSDWFAVVDTARDEDLYPLVMASQDWTCLISGKLDPALAPTLPYIVRLSKGRSLADAWQARGWGRGWGITLQYEGSTDNLRRHFKRFLFARLPDGMVAMFRFYDPLVFRRYLHASTPDEASPWFRGVDRYYLEGDTPGLLHDLRFEGRLVDNGQPV